jgi:hypothetical protein
MSDEYNKLYYEPLYAFAEKYLLNPTAREDILKEARTKDFSKSEVVKMAEKISMGETLEDILYKNSKEYKDIQKAENNKRWKEIFEKMKNYKNFNN